jgi:glycosyltransferase involved in cell wall biosynthesis
MLYSCRGNFFKEWKDKGIWMLIKYYLLAWMANQLVFPSKYMQGVITKKIEKPSKVIYGPYNIEELRKMRIKKKKKNGKYVFLAVTSFKFEKKAKGILLLKNTFKKFKKIYPKSKIIIIGSGEHLKPIRKKTTEKDISFLGKQNRDEVYKNMKNCDCFIHITDLDNLPLSIVEAAAFEKQIIASNKFGIPEISKKILLVDNTPKDILNKMLEAYEKNEEKVRHNIIKFSSKRMGENFANLYEKIGKSKN